MTCCSGCPICFNSYQPLSSSNCVPRFLFCGHTYCSSCVQQLTLCDPKSPFFPCPICRRAHQKLAELQSYPVNYALVDSLSPQECHSNSHGLQRCPDHPREIQKYYDRECHCFVCCDCIAIGKHSGHLCQRVEEFHRVYSPHIVTIISADQQIFHLPRTIASLSEAIDELITDDTLMDGFILPDINGTVMTHIIQFLFHLHEEPLAEIHKPLQCQDLSHLIPPWYYEFIQRGTGDEEEQKKRQWPFDFHFLSELLLAADILKISPLLYLAAAALHLHFEHRMLHLRNQHL